MAPLSPAGAHREREKDAIEWIRRLTERRSQKEIKKWKKRKGQEWLPCEPLAHGGVMHYLGWVKISTLLFEKKIVSRLDLGIN
jgi:hypothetical protein